MLGFISTALRKVVGPRSLHECLCTLSIHFQFCVILKRGYTVLSEVQRVEVHAGTNLDQAFEAI